MDMAEHAKKHVRVSARGPKAVLEVDGESVGALTIEGYTISQVMGQLPNVVLHVAEDHEVLFEGLARVMVGLPPEPGPAAAAFLGAIDPGELERAVLARHDLHGGPHGLAGAMLVQLAEWARGD